MTTMFPAAVLAACLAAPAFAAGAAPAADPADAAGTVAGAPQAASHDDGEKKICTRERKTGTTMLTRVCRTKAQIAADREQARDAMRRGEQTRFTPPGGGDL